MEIRHPKSSPKATSGLNRNSAETGKYHNDMNTCYNESVIQNVGIVGACCADQHSIHVVTLICWETHVEFDVS